MVKGRILSMVLVMLASSCFASQDPTAPLGWNKPVVAAQAKPKVKQYRLPTLNSIVCNDATDCVAILNGRIVEQGTLFNGYRVSRINSEFLTLTRGGRQWKLELFNINVKK